MSTVGIQESAADIYNGLSAPVHHKSWTLCHYRYGYSLQIFLCRISQKTIHVFGIHHNCHTLLRLGNGDLCTVQACVFLRNPV